VLNEAMNKHSFLLIVLMYVLLFEAHAQQVSTLAGSGGQSGFQDATGSAARFNEPTAVAADRSGNIYIADKLNHRIRRCSPSGQVTTLAGNGLPGATDGPAATASFYEPSGIACDTLGNVYVCDTRNYKIRKIDSFGQVTTLAGIGVFGVTDGPAAFARFGFPVGIAVTQDGNTIMVSDYNTHTIRRLRNDTVTTVAGAAYFQGILDGSGSAARFDHPSGLAFSSSGILYICDEWNNRIRTMTPGGQVITLAGTGLAGHADGPLNQAQFNHPSGICLDPNGNAYVSDLTNEVVRKLQPSTNTVTTYAGGIMQPGWVDGSVPAPRFNQPLGTAYDVVNRRLLVVEKGNHVVRRCEQISSVQLSVNLPLGTPCAGIGFTVSAAPQGLSQYSLSINGAPAGTSASGVFTLSGLPSGNYTFIAQAVDAAGAIATSSPLTIQIATPVVPVLSSSAASGLCPGAIGSIQATGGVSYQWSTGATGSSISIQASGTYTVTATGTGGCTGTSSLQIQSLSAPIVQVSSSNDTICPSSQASLTASGASIYTWSTGAVTTTISVPVGTYTVTGTASNGCTSVSSAMTIFNYPTPVPVLNPSGTIVLIQGESIDVQASGLQSYQWSTGSTSSSITVSQSGNYAVSGLTSNGCTSGTATIQVNIITTAQLIQQNGPSDFCEGDSLILQSVVSPGNQWNLNGAPIVGATLDTYVVTASGVYTVSVQRNGQTITSDPITVQVFPTPQAPLLQDTVVCSGTSALLTIDSLPGFRYTWFNLADLSQAVSTSSQWTTAPLTQTTQWTVTLESPQGCILEQAAILTARVEEIPQPEFTTQVSSSGGAYSVSCSYSGTAYSTLDWSMRDPSGMVQTSSLSNPVFNCTDVGQYTITCAATGASGCAAEISRSIYVGPFTKPFVPTTFTPNGDGRNDVFRLRGEQFSVVTLEIIDQWGNRMFTGGTQWDGRCADGQIRNGTYLYHFQYADASSQTFELSGTITVVQ